jgi:hypothetical protein
MGRPWIYGSLFPAQRAKRRRGRPEGGEAFGISDGVRSGRV